MSENRPWEAARHIGIYDLLEKIDTGGMSTVYKGRNEKTNQVVAVKIASQAVAEDANSRKRFELEYEFVQRLQHPNLAMVLDCGRDWQVPYLVMEYVDGPSLAQRLKSEGRLEEPEALAIFGQVADALTYLHGMQIIHRDIKPANILLLSSGRVKLIDFGLSKNLEAHADLTRSRIGLGTMQFASPEQFDDARSADARSDIYSLAVTMYVALTGEVPYGLGSPINVLKRKLLNRFDAPISKNTKLSPGMDAAIRLGMYADRNRRPGSCREMVDLWTGKQAPPTVLPGTVPGQEPNLVDDAAEKERRARIRYGADMKSNCRSIAAPSNERWQATIKDISTTGMCLRVERRFEIGSVLDILFSMQMDGEISMQMARVRWVKHSDGGSWLLGCEFVAPLSEDDLESFFNYRMSKTDMT